MGTKGQETRTRLKLGPQAQEAVGQELAAFQTLISPREREIQRDLVRAINAPTAELVGMAPGLDGIAASV